MKAEFFISQKITLAASTSISFLGITSDTPNVSFYPYKIDSTDHRLEVVLTSNPTVTVNGTPVVPKPKDLKSTLTPETLAFVNPTVTTAGDEVGIFPVFADKHVGGSYSNGAGAIYLERNTPYLYTITNTGNAPTVVYVNFSWEEVQ